MSFNTFSKYLEMTSSPEVHVGYLEERFVRSKRILGGHPCIRRLTQMESPRLGAVILR